MSTLILDIGSLTLGTANIRSNSHRTATHRLHLRRISKAVSPTHPLWEPLPGQATNFLKVRIAEGIGARLAADIEETARVLGLGEAPAVEGSRAGTGDPVAAAPELLRASLKMRAQDVQPRKQAQV